MKDRIGAEIEITVDDIELTRLEAESERRGISINELATEEFVAGLDRKFKKNRGSKCPKKQNH